MPEPDTVWTEQRHQRPPAGVRARVRRPDGARHRRGRLHGLAPDRSARRCSAHDVHAFVRATSSGALNNIGHLRRELKVHFADLTDRTSVDYLIRDLGQGGRPAVHLPPRRAGPRRRVLAPAVRDADGQHGRDAQPPPVDRRPRPRDREVRHRGHLRGVRQRPRARPAPPRLRRRGQPDPPRALADQPEVDLRDEQGRRRLPDHELPRRVRPADARHADVQQLRPASEPALRDRDDHHPGPRARARRARPARADARLLLLHGRRPRPSHRHGARRPRRRLRLRPGREHRDARLGGPDPPGRRGGGLLGRPRGRHASPSASAPA